MTSPSFPPGFDPGQFFAARSIGHGRRLGIAYRAHGADWCELELPYAAELVADIGTGVIASGAIVTLMDMATSVGAWLKRGAFTPHATLDLRIDYLRPATPGRTVIGRGECYRTTRSVAFVRGQAHDGDPANPVAHCRRHVHAAGCAGMILPPYAALLGLTAELVEDRPVLTLPFAEDVIGRPGFLHGGAIAGLLEMAAVTALRHALNDASIRVKPITVTVDYMRGGRDAVTMAAGTVLRLGTRIANIEATAWQDDRDRPIAAARMNCLLRR